MKNVIISAHRWHITNSWYYLGRKIESIFFFNASTLYHSPQDGHLSRFINGYTKPIHGIQIERPVFRRTLNLKRQIPFVIENSDNEEKGIDLFLPLKWFNDEPARLFGDLKYFRPTRLEKRNLLFLSGSENRYTIQPVSRSKAAETEIVMNLIKKA